jgi:hypothetical protein
MRAGGFVACKVGDLSCMEYTVQYFCSLWEVGYGGYERGFVGCVAGYVRCMWWVGCMGCGGGGKCVASWLERLPPLPSP